MTIAIMSKKGGSGKSSTSILLYEAFRQAKKTVAVRDWDPQGTATRALSYIGSEPVNKPDILIYDTPPSLDHPATASAVMAADIVLIMTSPSPADLWEVDHAAKFVRQKNPKAVSRIVFNRVRKGTVLGRLIDESAKQMSLPALGSSISARECYQHAVGQGWKALDGPAREEVLKLTAEVLALRAVRARSI